MNPLHGANRRDWPRFSLGGRRQNSSLRAKSSGQTIRTAPSPLDIFCVNPGIVPTADPKEIPK